MAETTHESSIEAPKNMSRIVYEESNQVAPEQPPHPLRDQRCSICSRLQDGETVTEYVYPDPDLNDPAQELVQVPSRSFFYLKRCPECGTYYRLHHLCYEFLLCSPGSYDEYRLERLTNEAAAEEVTPDGADSSRGTE